MATPPPNPETYGWDTVFAVDVDVVNAYLARLPASPEYIKTAPGGAGGSRTLTWTFGNWSITDTPGGSKLEVKIPFHSGKLVQNGVETSLTSWSCKVTFPAHFDTTDTSARLVARTKSGANWVESLFIVDTRTDVLVTTDEAGVVQAMMLEWFVPTSKPGEPPPPPPSDAITLFNREFLTVDFGADAGAKGVEWLKPIWFGFAGGVMADGDTKALGILAMTADPDEKDQAKALAAAKARAADPKTLVALSPYAIPEGATAGFLMSSHVVLRNLLIPGCQYAFNGDVGDYQIREGNTVTNAAELSFTQKMDGSDRDAYLEKGALTVEFFDDKLNIKMSPMVVSSQFAGLKVDATVDQAYTAYLDTAGGDEPKPVMLMTAYDLQPPSTSVHQGTGVAVSETLLPLAFLAVTTALAIVTPKGLIKGAKTRFNLSDYGAKIWSRVIVVGVGGLLTIASSLYGWFALDLAIHDHDIPDFSTTLNAGLGKITWPGNHTTVFHPTAVRFAKGLLVTVSVDAPSV
jgi:hypothetical protein